MRNVEKEEMQTVLQKTYVMTLNRSAHIRSWFGIEREFERYHTRLRKKELKKPMKINFDHQILDAPENLNNHFAIQNAS